MPPDPLHAFRVAAAADGPAVVEIMRTYYEEDGYAFDGAAALRAVETLAQSATLGRLWVAELDGSIAGYLAVTLGFSLEYQGRDAFVDELFLLPRARGRGLGSEALDLAERYCRSQGALHLHLEVEGHRGGAASLYLRRGYVEHERRRMTKRLSPSVPAGSSAKAGRGSTREGGCHCGRVRFAIDVAEPAVVYECNCSICRRLAYLHLIVEKSRFRLTSGESELREYRFNTRRATHTFCGQCGVKAFYTPRSHPEGVSVNARCLDDPSSVAMQVTAFDGAHWEEAFARLRPTE